MNQKIQNILMVALLIGIIGIGGLTAVQQMNYQNLDSQYQNLLSEYGALDTVYEQAIEDYEIIYDLYQSKVAEYDQLNITYTSLLSTHDSLLDVYGTVADELLDTISGLVDLNITYANLMSEFEDLNVTYYILTGDYDALNASYILLTQQYDELNTTYWSLLDSYEILQLEIDALSISYDQLQAEHNLLQVEYDALLSDFDTLSITYNTLLDNYATLQSDHEALQSDYNNLWLNYNTLWAAHQALQDNYDALQIDYNNLQIQYNQLQTDYSLLEQDYLNLQTEYDILSDSYLLLQGEYDACVLELTQLQADYDDLNVQYWALDTSYVQLQAEYDALELAYNTLATWIRQQILPAQYMVFAEAVRRYYFEDFYVQNKWGEGNISGYWAEFARFCRDVILHDSHPSPTLAGSWFPDVSNALANCLRFGNQTEFLAFYNLYMTFFPWLSFWGGWYTTGDNLTDIDLFVQWCIDKIDYEYDTDIVRGQEPYTWDYIKFPVETVFRTKGDCEDQAILTAAYLESCGFETVMAVFHDDDHPTYGSFYHGVLLVHIEDTTVFWERYPDTPLWQLGSVDPYEGTYSWCWLDTTWDTPFGTEPAWLPAYAGLLSYADVSLAICDLDGAISYVAGTPAGIVGDGITSYQP